MVNAALGKEQVGSTDPAVSKVWLPKAVSLTSAAVFAAGLATIGVVAWIFVVGYTPVPYGDYWPPLVELARGEHWYSIDWLWHQHNEHRVPWNRLAIAADVYLFGGRAIFPLTLTFLTLVCHAALWTIFLKRAVKLAPAIWFAASGVIVYCVFCPYQIGNFVWSWEWTDVVCLFFASVAFLSLLSLTEAARGWYAVILSSIAAFCAEASLASGLVAWPILWALAWAVPLRRSQRASLIAAGVVSVAVFFHGYQSLGSLKSLHRPGRVLEYQLAYLDTWMKNFVTFPGLLAVFGLTAGVAATIFLLRRHDTRLLAFGLASMELFILGVSFLTAVGRLPNGLAAVNASRYQGPVMMLWASLAVAMLVAAAKLNLWRDVLALNALAWLIICSQVSFLREALPPIQEGVTLLDSNGESFEAGAADAAIMNSTLGFFNVNEAVVFLHRLGDHLGPPPLYALPRPVTHLRAATSECQGALEFTGPVARLYPGPKVFRVEGWARKLNRMPPGAIAITDGDGRVLATSALHLMRLAGSVPGLQTKGPVGWRVYVPTPDGVTSLHAFAIVDGGRACALNGVGKLTGDQ